jgi:hypothetical protein
VSDQHSSYSSVLRTTEILLGLRPLTLFDATAVALAGVIGDRVPSRAPAYTAVAPEVPFLTSPPGQTPPVASAAAVSPITLARSTLTHISQ